MKTLLEIILMIDDNVQRILISRFLSEEEFINKFQNEQLYNYLHNSKCGYIRITNFDTGETHYGITGAFGENIGCYMSNEDEWFTTSIIQKIDWDKKKFQTMNSVYKFEFEELPQNILDDMKKNYESEQNESKN